MGWRRWGGLALVGAVSLGGTDARASCYAFVAPEGEAVTNADSSVIVAFDGASTWVTMASDARGDSPSFGYLLPVPAGCSVSDADVVPTEVFDGLQDWVAPRQVETSCAAVGATNGIVSSGCGGVSGLAAGDLPTLGELETQDSIVAEHRTLGAYELSVLDTDRPSRLNRWLHDHGFQLGDEARPMVDELVEQGVWFLAVEVDGTGRDGDPAAWVEPLKLRYDGRMDVLPLALGATSSAGVQDLVVLVVDDGPVGISNYREVEIERECMVRGDLDETYDALVDAALLDGVDGRAGWATEAVVSSVHQWATEDDLDPDWLAQVGRPDAWGTTLTRLHLRYAPDQIDEDLLLQPAPHDVQTSTYLVWDEQLESTWPVCGEGWVGEGAGSCPVVAASTGGQAPVTGSCESIPVTARWAPVLLLVGLARRRPPVTRRRSRPTRARTP
ncbi:MAG: DUF2330 domain-containing protein [Myxococcales bacterium]|nr:DUF2330 domain-containing protein [Myxococcales bacterium]